MTWGRQISGDWGPHAGWIPWVLMYEIVVVNDTLQGTKLTYPIPKAGTFEVDHFPLPVWWDYVSFLEGYLIKAHRSFK